MNTGTNREQSMATIGNYYVVRETPHMALLERDDGKRTVVDVDWDAGQVYSAMPGDMPSGGGIWYGALTTNGVDYVAGWYSRSYAGRVWNSKARPAR